MELVTALQEALIRYREIHQKHKPRMRGVDIRLDEERVVLCYEGDYWRLCGNGEQLDAVILSEADFNSDEWEVAYY